MKISKFITLSTLSLMIAQYGLPLSEVNGKETTVPATTEPLKLTEELIDPVEITPPAPVVAAAEPAAELEKNPDTTAEQPVVKADTTAAAETDANEPLTVNSELSVATSPRANGVEFQFSNGVITGIDSTPENWDGHLVIPAEINTQSVSEIAEQAFVENKKIKSVTFEAGSEVTSIGNYAFYGCLALASVTFPETLGTLGEAAFQYCDRLTSVDLSKTQVTSLESSAFDNCPTLASVTFPETLVTLGEFAFQSCYGLTSVDLSKTQVTSIGYSAFCNCPTLASVTFPETLVTLGESAFQHCKGLTSVDLSKTQVISIGRYAFYGCSALASVTFPETLVTLDEAAFQSCDGLTSVDLSKTRVTSLERSAFEGCSALASVTFPETLVTLGEAAFQRCTGLTSVDLSKTQVTSLKRSAFYDCKALASVTFPETLVTLGNTAFQHCQELKEVIFPTGITSIGDVAFAYCKNLKNVVLPATAANFTLGTGVFNVCETLETITTMDQGLTKLHELMEPNNAGVRDGVRVTYDTNKKVSFSLNQGTPIAHREDKFFIIQENTATAINYGLSGKEVPELATFKGLRTYWQGSAGHELAVTKTPALNKPFDANYTNEKTWTDVSELALTDFDLTGVSLSDHYNGKIQGINQNALKLTGVPAELGELAPPIKEVKYKQGNHDVTPKDAGEYAVNLVLENDNKTTANLAISNYTITPYQLSAGDITFAGKEKEFDGTKTANLKADFEALAEDDATIAISDAQYAAKEVGTHQISYDWSLTGKQGGNYQLPTVQPEVSGTITNQTITDKMKEAIVDKIEQLSPAKVYDSKADHKFDVDISEIVNNGEVIKIQVVGEFDSRNAGKRTFTPASWNVKEGSVALGELPDFKAIDGEITAKPVTVDYQVAEKEYDGTRTVALRDITTADFVKGDDVKTIENPVGTLDSKNVGERKVTAKADQVFTGADLKNYKVTFTEKNCQVTAKPVTGTVSVKDKVYDGTTGAKVKDIKLTGAITGDKVSLDIENLSAAFEDKNVGEDKVVTATGLDLKGADKDNYTLEITANPAKITKKTVTPSFTIQNKVYNGQKDAVVEDYNFNGMVDGDDLSLDQKQLTANFKNKDVGTKKNVVVKNVVTSGNDAGNYQLAAEEFTVKGAITVYEIPADQITFAGLDKAFDNSNKANLTATFPVFGEDKTAIKLSDATYATKGIGNDQEITYKWGLSDNEKGNYQLPEPQPKVTGNITNPEINSEIQGEIADLVRKSTPEKVYDGKKEHHFEIDISELFEKPTRRDTLSEKVVLKVTGKFKTKMAVKQEFVVTNWEVTPKTISLGNVPNGLTANGEITPKPVAATYQADKTKVYDGTTEVAISKVEVAEAFIKGDVVDWKIKPLGTLNSKDVGKRSVTVQQENAFTGKDLANYVIDFGEAQTSEVTPKALKVTAKITEKIYDGTTNAAIESENATFDGIIKDEKLMLDPAKLVANFNDKNVGKDKKVVITPVKDGTLTDSLTDNENGEVAKNYTIKKIAGTGIITPKAITITDVKAVDRVAKAGDKTVELTGGKLDPAALISGDELKFVLGTGTIASDKAGEYDVTTNIKLDGKDKGNYNLTQPTDVKVTITDSGSGDSGTGTSSGNSGTTGTKKTYPSSATSSTKKSYPATGEKMSLLPAGIGAGIVAIAAFLKKRNKK